MRCFFKLVSPSGNTHGSRVSYLSASPKLSVRPVELLFSHPLPSPVRQCVVSTEPEALFVISDGKIRRVPFYSPNYKEKTHSVTGVLSAHTEPGCIIVIGSCSYVVIDRDTLAKKSEKTFDYPVFYYNNHLIVKQDSASDDRMVLSFMDVTTRKATCFLSHCAGVLQAVYFSRDKQAMAAVSNKDELVFYDFKRQLSFFFSLSRVSLAATTVRHVAVSRTQVIFSDDKGKMIYSWAPDRNTLLTHTSSHPDGLFGVWSDECYALSVSSSGDVKIVDMTSGTWRWPVSCAINQREYQRLLASPGDEIDLRMQVSCMAVAYPVAAVGFTNGSVFILNIRESRKITELKLSEGEPVMEIQLTQTHIAVLSRGKDEMTQQRIDIFRFA